MTLQEFSDEFDVLYNNIMSNQAPGLTEYEKSIFLTKAQEDLIREYFNAKVDGTEGGFDGSQKRQYDFSQLLKVETLKEIEKDEITKKAITQIDTRSKVYKFPANYFLSVNEIIKDSTSQYSVISISYSDYQRLMGKPYAYPPKRMAWRLFNSYLEDTETPKDPSSSTGDADKSDTETPKKRVIIAEIIGKFPQEGKLTYSLRYIQKPTPIILENLSNARVSIEGVTTESECLLPSQTHQEILERAVTLAKITYQGGTTQTLAASANRNNQQQ